MKKNHTTRIAISLFSGILFVASGCGDSKKDLVVNIPEPDKQVEQPAVQFKDYYFPIDSMVESRVYKYVEDSSGATMYWVFSTKKENNQTLFKTDAYLSNSDGTLSNLESLTEEIRVDGSYILAYKEYQKDINGKPFEAVAFMKSACVYKWNLMDNESLLWSFESTSKENPLFFSKTTKTRTYTGKTEDIFFDGDTIPAVLFTDDYTLEIMNSQNGRGKLYQFSQTSYYAKNIGLYMYSREINGVRITCRLADILTSDEWEKLKK